MAVNDTAVPAKLLLLPFPGMDRLPFPAPPDPTVTVYVAPGVNVAVPLNKPPAPPPPPSLLVAPPPPATTRYVAVIELGGGGATLLPNDTQAFPAQYSGAYMSVLNRVVPGETLLGLELLAPIGKLNPPVLMLMSTTLL
jgi:hypothetical protein